MAETFFNQMAYGKAEDFSAGTQSSETMGPVVVEAMLH